MSGGNSFPGICGAIASDDLIAFLENNLIQPQCFTDGPRLERATSWCMWRSGISYFRNVSETGVIKMREDGCQEFFTGSAFGFA